MNGYLAVGHPAEFKVTEHAGAFRRDADDRMSGAFSDACRAYSVGTGEVINEQGIGALFAHERVYPREITTGASEAAAVRVAPDK